MKIDLINRKWKNHPPYPAKFAGKIIQFSYSLKLSTSSNSSQTWVILLLPKTTFTRSIQPSKSCLLLTHLLLASTIDTLPVIRCLLWNSVNQLPNQPAPNTTPTCTLWAVFVVFTTILDWFIQRTILDGFIQQTIIEGFILQTILVGFTQQTILDGFIQRTIIERFILQTILVGFTQQTILEEFIQQTIIKRFIQQPILAGSNQWTILEGFIKRTIL